MKMMKYRTNILVRVCAMAALLAVGATMQAQTYTKYTLTNGSLWWYEGTKSDYEAGTGHTTYINKDTVTGVEFHRYDNVNVTNVTKMGDRYMKLDTTDAANPKLVAVDTAGGFDPLCVWLRSSKSTGYYFQEWPGAGGKTYRYYLYSPSVDTVVVARMTVGQPLERATEWYDWDFGAALIDGATENNVFTEHYYWIIYDSTDGGRWRMSIDAYDRPDMALYNGWTTDSAEDVDMGRMIGYVDNKRVKVSEGVYKNVPRGIPAQFSPVEETYHAKRIVDELRPSNIGLTAFDIVDTADHATSIATMKYGDVVELKPTVNVPGGTMVYVEPEYTAYEQQVRCDGMNTWWRIRDNDTSHYVFGSKGVVAESRTYYYYKDSPSAVSATRHTVAPSRTQEALVVVDTVYAQNNSSRRYVDIDLSGSTPRLFCKSVPPDGAKAIITVTVRYSNGTSDSKSDTIVLSSAVATKDMGSPVNAPVVRGSVFGGGRVADVNGVANVTVHSCDTVGTIYGGNDIAGAVQSTKVQLGSSKTTDTYRVRAGYVYGGGCGYYNYAALSQPIASSEKTFSGYVYPYDYQPVGDEATDAAKRVVADNFAAGTHVPSADSTLVSIGTDSTAANNEYVLAHTVFGGAANAFVGVASKTAARVDMYGGVAYAVFGGNNYGGGVESGSIVKVNIAGTKTTDEKNTENTYFGGYGHDFGVRYVYGGGNLVESSNSVVTVTGGMIDSCYLGGNQATVSTPVGTVNCTGGNYIFENDSITKQWEGGVLVDKPLPANYANLVNHDPRRFSTGTGRYNVRCFFGGNNKAPMTSLSRVNLLSGGISRVYGGGNAGDMRYDGALSAEVTAGINNALDGWNYEVPTTLGAIVHSTKTSQVMVERIYGGCRMANVKTSSALWLSGGAFGYVSGGNDISGDVGSETGGGSYVVIDSNALVLERVYGGSDGYYHCHGTGKTAGTYVEGDTLREIDGTVRDYYDDYLGYYVPTQNSSNLYINGGRVLSAAYGGGVMTDVGFKEESGNKIVFRDSLDVTNGRLTNGVRDISIPALLASSTQRQGKVHFQMNQGTVGSDTDYGMYQGNAYGGGYLSSIFGLSYLNVGGTSVIKGSLYAGNDCMGSISSFGGFSTPTQDYEHFTASNGEQLNVNDGSSWKASTDTYLLLTGTPTIRSVYGGGNGAYDYDGTAPEYSSAEVVCYEGVGGQPFQSKVFIDINTSGGRIDTVFGGGNGVGVRDGVKILLNNTTPSVAATGTIFGGNNVYNMAVVPEIMLEQGMVENVYGGGNHGSMTKLDNEHYKDVCGNPVYEVSTYVKVENASVSITGNLFGGCRMADVEGMAYIDIRNTNASGVMNVYGGNDISGSINGNTRVDVSGGTVHHIYGGSNGYYDYKWLADGEYKVYKYGYLDNPSSFSADPDTVVAELVSSRPFVDSTTLNLFGGTLTKDIFGGGRMGDCRLTNVVVNDSVCPATLTPALTIEGVIYGGGEGEWSNLHKDRLGNVVRTDSDHPGATHVNLHHATTISASETKVFGGGKGGDVQNTYVESYGTWDIPFQEIYGGCWGSDVLEQTHLILRGNDSDPEALTARNVFGGNDFTGNVGKSNILIESGRYTNIYGAGNGDYEAVGSYDTGAYAASGMQLYAPNSEWVEINFEDGEVVNQLYGGGKFGTTMTYKRDAAGRYVLDANGRKIADTVRALSSALLPYKSPDQYSHIIINVKGGVFQKNIYAGAAGAAGGPQLVYGLKELNISGSPRIGDGVYGGSENVNDGYPECDSNGYYLKNEINPLTSRYYGRTAFTNTTARPSTIINITGGRVNGNVYAGGYLGEVRGSLYVNIGKEAVNECPIWAASIYDSTAAYASFKPGAVGGKVDVMGKGALYIGGSVYMGANWGNNSGNADFSKIGVLGGESRMIVDGKDYDTYLTGEIDDSLMTIGNSLIGSGTSASGGDMYSRVDVRNYGAVGGACKPLQTLRSIQRADAVWLNNTAIDYTGSTDAVTAYLTRQFTINRVDTLNCVGYNVLDVDAEMTNIGEVDFYRQVEWPYTDRELTKRSDPDLCFGDESQPDCPACDADADVCKQLSRLTREPGENGAYTAFVMNNGISVELINNGVYSDVFGFAYIVAQSGTNAVVTAKAKYGTITYGDRASVLSTDPDPVASAEGRMYDTLRTVEYGGFLSTCSDSNGVFTATGDYNEVLSWIHCASLAGHVDGNCSHAALDGDVSDAEFPYKNYDTYYRVWSVGKGFRRRTAVIQAHGNPDKLASNKRLTQQYGDTVYDFCVAMDTLVLPPATPGHYFKIRTSEGVVIADDNHQLNLTETAFLPTTFDSMTDEWYMFDSVNASMAAADMVNGTDYIDIMVEPAANGGWVQLAVPDPKGVSYIHNNPGGYFGLLMDSGKNFASNDDGSHKPPLAAGASWTGYSTISGNKHVNVFNDFATSQVGNRENALPQLNLYLLYDRRFSNTLVGTVTFTLDECKSVPRRFAEGEHRGEVWYDTVDLGGGSYRYDTVWIDSVIDLPIEVEITISTILEEFNDMQCEVLAMYNEGRTNEFARNVPLPATLNPRTLYLTAIEWAPAYISAADSATGEWIADPMSPEPDYFYLTGDSTSILNQAYGVNNLFRITVEPTDKITNTATTNEGWHGLTVGRFDVYTAAKKTPANSSARVSNGNYYKGSTHGYDNPADIVSLIDPIENPYGMKMGELDGHGEASLKICLNYDGNRVYRGFKGKGYVGKVVLTMQSYIGGDRSNPNTFHITVNVKTREMGDTIYLASAPTLTRGGHTYTGVTDLSVDDAGKYPSKYVTSFSDALDDAIYQEGDVIAIIDTVKVNVDYQLFGDAYMHIPIIRYEGHHKELPGEACVYRGPMIEVMPGKSLTTDWIDFQGSSVSKIVPSTPGADMSAYVRAYNRIDMSDVKYLDTNKAYGPIIIIDSAATVTLNNGTIVENNYNAYTGSDSRLKGAISVPKYAKLQLCNNVEIKDNVSENLAGSTKVHPLNGAVYVDGGTVELLKSNSSTSVLIVDNYTKDASEYWKIDSAKVKIGEDSIVKPVGIRFDETDSKVDTYHRANVYLTRTVGAGDADLSDSQSDVIRFTDALPSSTRIGVSKWFPDDAEVKRDTMKIVYQKGTELANAIKDSIFSSDDGYFVFYNSAVNVQNIYLQRCATFRYQKVGEALSLESDGTYSAGNVLSYVPLEGATCPIGGDTLFYRIQGGLMPYTYTWTGSSSQTRSTKRTSRQVAAALADGDTSLYITSIVDTLVTTHISMRPYENSEELIYSVKAVDVTGNCELKKNVKVTLRKRDESVFSGDPFEPTAPMAAWTDVAGNPGDTARGDRNYKAIRIMPRVWADRSVGVISARLDEGNKDSIFTVVEGDRHPIDDMLFCQGDVIVLATAPRYKDVNLGPKVSNPAEDSIVQRPKARFVMWDFDPYYSNPAVYVVPNHSSAVVAYYGPLDYWKDTISDVELANAVYTSDYYYTSRPSGASYVTTHSGDVHIYDEDGLAWFISVVNGLNGTQARPFYFNKVYLHKKSAANKYGDATAYDMKSHLWTPVGTTQHRFRGWFIGVDAGETSTTPLAAHDSVVIKNIIADEPNAENVGFFAFLDSAKVSGVSLHGALIRGSQNVGTLAGRSVDTRVDNCSVLDSAAGLSNPTTTILVTHHTSGGMIGNSERDTVTNSIVKAKFVGDAVYSGGMVGYGKSTTVSNSFGYNDSRMSGLYVGGVAGYLDGTVGSKGGLFGRKSIGQPSVVTNNYVRLVSNKNAQRVGGIVGYARNTVIENNYVYGDVMASAAKGGVGAVADQGTRAEHNYYESGTAESATASTRGNAMVDRNSDFSGTGNQIELGTPTYGFSNLTRSLNRWVREQNAAGGNYRTWRSDLVKANNGYPVFGEPDMIPVVEEMTVYGCDSVDWDGTVYRDGDSLNIHYIDTVEMIDSTLAILFATHRSTVEHYADSAVAGEFYSGYGFMLTAAETALLQSTVDSLGSASIVLSDTLATVHGCDSVVTLTLTFTSNVALPEVAHKAEVKVYPNPTTASVTVEATGLQHVELYDNDGRRLADYDATAAEQLTIDVRRYPTGAYFVRVHAADGVTIQKLIKK